MYAFLIILGAIITAAGIVLVGSGISIQGHSLDLTTVTPGVVAAIGGLILLGLGFVLRLLQRIERAVAVRPLPVLPAEESTAAVIAEGAPEPTVTTGTEQAAAEPRVSPAPVAAAAPGDGAQAREKFPALVRVEGEPVVAENDRIMPARATMSIVPGTDRMPDLAVGSNGVALRRGGAPDSRQASVFESLWPKGPRAGVHSQAAAASFPVPVAAEPERRQASASEAVAAANPQQVAAAISILKSGVVDGMAYTLYSDGSIEAQLPRGTLRFGSIAELRNHVERGA